MKSCNSIEWLWCVCVRACMFFSLFFSHSFFLIPSRKLVLCTWYVSFNFSENVNNNTICNSIQTFVSLLNAMLENQRYTIIWSAWSFRSASQWRVIRVDRNDDYVAHAENVLKCILYAPQEIKAKNAGVHWMNMSIAQALMHCKHTNKLNALLYWVFKQYSNGMQRIRYAMC